MNDFLEVFSFALWMACILLIIPFLFEVLKVFKKINGSIENIDLNTEEMELVKREEFHTKDGTGIREVYRRGRYTLEVTCMPPEGERS